MHKLGKYNETDSMSGLIQENFRILLVMSRFRIGLGFGDKTIGEVCRENGVDIPTFLEVTNLLVLDDHKPDAVKVSIESLLGYLHVSHNYFLDFRLPGIRAELTEILGKPLTELTRAILRYFDEYVAEVRKHMMYEEETVFPYVRSLLAGDPPGDYRIDVFSSHHDQVEARLSEFKNILIRYYPVKSTNEINNVLFDIYNCENDLASHNAIENRLFVPAVRKLEGVKIRKR